ncbi:MAG: NAD(P)/FAD-dependent oxidoreductase [Acidobacteria bacterium]|nr:NAD(P)/FAD-dependent oxidoreductase [Acidobacteriota bacterium]
MWPPGDTRSGAVQLPRVWIQEQRDRGRSRVNAHAIVVGAGPAGTVAAIVLARAGAHVRLLDRATFPRPKLCGDTVNPGALATLRRLGLAECVERGALHLDGMIVTGADGARVDGAYAPPHYGLAIRRIDLDMRLLQEAIHAGVVFEERVRVIEAIVGDLPPKGGSHESPAKTGHYESGTRSARLQAGLPGGSCEEGGIVENRAVVGVRVRLRSGKDAELKAPITIAADGRRSSLAFGLGLARHPKKPRRYAIGAYYEGVAGLSPFGEMHVRTGHYLGIAAVPGSLTNVCLVVPEDVLRERRSDPARLLAQMIDREPGLRDRFAHARLTHPPATMGPLAVDVRRAGVPGLLLAGDAAGFIDPMTGDGLRFAIRGGELAGRAAVAAIEEGIDGADRRLARWRQREFRRKWMFNRGVRALVGSSRAVRALSAAARIFPLLLQPTIAFAGDVGL